MCLPSQLFLLPSNVHSPGAAEKYTDLRATTGVATQGLLRRAE